VTKCAEETFIIHPVIIYLHRQCAAGVSDPYALDSTATITIESTKTIATDILLLTRDNEILLFFTINLQRRLFCNLYSKSFVSKRVI
jgi:hypothetical protein